MTSKEGESVATFKNSCPEKATLGKRPKCSGEAPTLISTRVPFQAERPASTKALRQNRVHLAYSRIARSLCGWSRVTREGNDD